jgi:hypothetical protein
MKIVITDYATSDLDIASPFIVNEDLWIIPYGAPYFALNAAFAIVLCLNWESAKKIYNQL